MRKRNQGWSGIKTAQYKLNKDRLPSAHDFYRQEVIKLGKPNSKNWALGLCPFHHESNPSFSVNVMSGGYNCFGCKASGGDIIAFYMQKYNVDFKTACIELGVWGGLDNE